jgi:hypothetical protein
MSPAESCLLGAYLPSATQSRQPTPYLMLRRGDIDTPTERGIGGWLPAPFTCSIECLLELRAQLRLVLRLESLSRPPWPGHSLRAGASHAAGGIVNRHAVAVWPECMALIALAAYFEFQDHAADPTARPRHPPATKKSSRAAIRPGAISFRSQ